MRVAMLGWACLSVAGCAGCGRIGFTSLAPEDGGGDGGAPFRRPVTIVNLASLPLPAGYTVRVALVDVIEGGRAQTDLSDVRVLTAIAAPTEPGLDRTVELASPGEAAGLWFALSAPIAAGTQARYWLHYGRSDPRPPADPARVFPLVEAFDGATLSPTWQMLGAPTVTGGVLVLGAGDNAVTTVPATDGIGPASALEVRMTITNPTASGNYYWIGYQHEGGFGTGAPFHNWVGEDAAIHGWVNTTTNRRCPDLVADTAPHTYRIERHPDQTRYYLDGVSVCDVDITDAIDYSLQLRNQSPATELRIDAVRARALITPEPDVVVGPEQPAFAPGS